MPDELGAYRKKRDTRRSGEPAGRRGRRGRGRRDEEKPG